MHRTRQTPGARSQIRGTRINGAYSFEWRDSSAAAWVTLWTGAAPQPLAPGRPGWSMYAHDANLNSVGVLDVLVEPLP